MSKTFTNNLRKIRDDMRLTQSEMSAVLGMNRPRYASYEEGRAEPSYEDLVIICRILKIKDVMAFIGGFEFKNEKVELSYLERKYLQASERDKKLIQLILGIQ